MKITSEDIHVIQRKLDSLKKMKQLSENKEHFAVSKKSRLNAKLEDDVFDSEKFFDED